MVGQTNVPMEPTSCLHLYPVVKHVLLGQTVREDGYKLIYGELLILCFSLRFQVYCIINYSARD